MHTMKKRSLNPIFYTEEGSQPFPTLELIKEDEILITLKLEMLQENFKTL